MHLPEPARSRYFASLAGAVDYGGILLIVGHDVSDEAGDGQHAHLVELMFDADDVRQAIVGAGLTVEIAESRARAASDHRGGGHEGVAHDVVVRARRTR
jgi:hypothetical protein